jgi:ferredoxin
MASAVQDVTAVLLCEDLEILGDGIDLREVREWLQLRAPAVRVQIVAGLERAPAEMPKIVAATGATRLVLGLCSREYSRAALQRQTRKAGLDPLGVEVVNLGAHAALAQTRNQATERAKILLAARVARAEVFRGSGPQNLKPCLPTKMSRRELFSLPAPEYRSVPSLEEGRCVEPVGCSLCRRSCPCEAMSVEGRRIRVDKSNCQSCGLCLTACPRDAIHLPGAMPSQLAVEITTLLDNTMGPSWPRTILLSCERTATALEKAAHQGSASAKRERGSVASADDGPTAGDRLPVELPCLAMLPASWLLWCLSMGASVVELTPCVARCELGQQDNIRGMVDFSGQFLERLGDRPDRVRFMRRARPSDELRRPVAAEPVPSQTTEGPPRTSLHRRQLMSFGPMASADMLLDLAEEGGVTTGVSVAHPSSPFGLVDVSDGCTACGVCAAVCPSSALAMEQEEDGRSLVFTPRLCNACGQCVDTCPESDQHVLVLQKATDLARIFSGPTVLFSPRYVRCEACGAPMATESMLRRVEAILGGADTSLWQAIGGYCNECRLTLGTAPSNAASYQSVEVTSAG